MNRHWNRVVYKVFSVIVFVALLMGLVPALSKAPLPAPVSPVSSSLVLSQAFAQEDQPSQQPPADQEGPPTEPFSVIARQVSPTQVDLRWANTSPFSSGFRIERSTDPAFTGDVATFTVANPDVAVYSDTSVTAGSTFFYRVFAVNDVGDSPPSRAAKVFVLENPSQSQSQGLVVESVAPAVRTDAASDITESGARLNGSLTVDGSASLLLAYFEWGTDTKYGNTSERALLSDAGSFSASLSNLKPATIYHYRAVVVGQGVGISHGADQSFVTSTAPPAPTGDSPSPTPAPLAPRQKAEIQVSPDADASVVSPDEKITLFAPKGAVSTPVTIEMAEYAPIGSTGTRMLSLIDLNASVVATGEKITQFNKELQLAIRHQPEDLAGLDVDSLGLYYLDPISREWAPVPSRFDRDTKTLTATITHFSTYGELGDTLASGPGRVLAAQVSPHSGAAAFTYPLELPAGPGGFKPKLELIYNSGGVDEMKDKRATGSWVGIGWTMDLGRISYDDWTRTYFLDIGGVSYPLATTDDTNYRTNPESYFKITRDENTWTVLDRDGIAYQFGGTTGTTGSEQYYYDDTLQQRVYNRWDLSQITDTDGNQATVTYQKDVRGTSPNDTVRAAYPEYLKWNGTTAEVYFILGTVQSGGLVDRSVSGDGDLRPDNPFTSSGHPAPKIMETRRLDSVEVKFAGSLVRSYAFGYSSVAVGNPDYYAGKLKLTSITQVGANGSSTLPAMTFTYSDKQIYRHTSETDYSGNPGNAASLYWPYLVNIGSGYSGGSDTITFAYTQKPSTSTDNIWTREVVTGKTVKNGISGSPDQTYTYDYITGTDPNPQYSGYGWDQKYRGFGIVTETDAATNYVKHYYYTTGIVDGEDHDKLTGREYKTEWYDSGNTKLKEAVYDWAAVTTSAAGVYDYLNRWSGDGTGSGLLDGNTYGIVTHGDYVYITEWDANSPPTFAKVQKFDKHGKLLDSWGSVGSGDGQFSQPNGIAVDSSGNVYVADTGNNRIQKFDSDGGYLDQWGTSGSGNGQFNSPYGLAIDSQGYIYVTDSGNQRVQKFGSDKSYQGQWGSSGSGNGQFNSPHGIAVDSQGYVYVADTDNHRVQKFSSSGVFQTAWGSSGSSDSQFSSPEGIAIDGNDNVFVADQNNYYVKKFSSTGSFLAKKYVYRPRPLAVSAESLYTTGRQRQGYSNYGVWEFIRNWTVQLGQVDQTTGSKTSRTRYAYDSYGNVVTEYRDGDISEGATADNSTIWRVFYPNTTANIMGKPARERVYSGTRTSDNGSYLQKETVYYYDGHNDGGTYPPLTTAPDKGNVTRIQQSIDASTTVSSYFTYDSYGNKLTEEDPDGNITETTYEATYDTYQDTKTFPVTGLEESYTYDTGTSNLLTVTDVNGQVTTYEYDTFKRLTSVDKPLGQDPDVEYEYLDWGTLGQQRITTTTYIDANNNLWQSQYFDGVGRVVQVHSNGETNYTIVSGTTSYNSRGLVDKEYVAQNLLSSGVSGYEEPVVPPAEGAWKVVTYAYDALNRLTLTINADSTWVTHDLSTVWQDTVTNARGYDASYYFDAFGRLTKVEEPSDGYALAWQSSGLDDSEFDSPSGIATDASGNVYVADSAHHRVQKFSSSGTFITAWGGYGSGDGQFNSPYGIAVDGLGYVYVADTNYHRIQKFDSSGAFVAKWGGNGSGDGQFSYPRGIAIDSSGNIYVADTGNNRVQKFNSSRAFVAKWGTNGTGDGQFDSPNGVAEYGSDIFVTDTNNHRVQRFSSTGTFLSKWGSSGAGDGQFSYPRGIADDSSGNLFVADSGNNRVQKFNSSGTFLTKWGSSGAGDGQFASPAYTAVDSSGNVYVTDANNSRVQKFTNSGGFTTKWGSYAAPLSSPRHLAVSAGTNIYVADTGNNRMEKWDSTGALVARWGSSGAGDGQFNTPSGVAVDGSGNVYVADTFNHRIQKFSGAGSFLGWFGKDNNQHVEWHNPGSGEYGVSGSGNGEFNQPMGIAVDASGNIYVADTGNHRIQKFNSSGGFTAAWGGQGSADGQFQSPYGLALDGLGNVFVSDSGNHRIQKLNSSTGAFLAKWGTQGSGDGQFSQPYGVMVDSQGYTYVADMGNNRIQKFSSAGVFAAKWGTYGSGKVQFYAPYGIALDGSGHVYIADTTNNRIQKLDQAFVVATTTYEYDVLGNLTDVADAAGNPTVVHYDWLSRKTTIEDPDMGGWYYKYDANGNLASQVDSNSNAINLYYDAMNRLKGKTYTSDVSTPSTYTRPSDPGTGNYDVEFTYDAYSTSAPTNYGKGKRTGMIDDVNDSSNPSTYRYDTRGRLIEETRKEYSNSNWNSYTTGYAYDGADRLTTVTYPTGETVTNGYNGRGLPSTVSGSTAGNLVTSTLYNSLGQVTEVNLNNGLRTTFGYYGTGGGYDASGGLFGRLWEIKTLPQAGGTAIQDTKHMWDTGGNLIKREDVLVNHTESFSYDSLDRLVQTKYEASTFGDSGSGQTSSPQKAAFDPEGNILVVDQANSRVVKYRPDGTYVTAFGSYGTTDGKFRNPTGIAVDPSGYVYVSDGSNNRVQKFYPDLTYDSKFGNYGTGNSNFKYPTDVALDSSGNIYVSDAFNYKVKKFNSSFTYQTSWGGVGTPLGLDVDTQDYVYVAVSGSPNAVKKFDTSGNQQASFTISSPGDVDVDADGNMYIADYDVGAIREMDPSGTTIADWESAGTGQTNFSGPNGVALGNRQVFVVDTGNNRVQGIEVYLPQTYDKIGNITEKDGKAYTYSTVHVHAVVDVAGVTYDYDYNGNMTDRGSQTITWDEENRPLTVTGGASFVYDGDGDRVKKTENSVTILYVNKYYEKDLTNNVITTYYYLGGRLVAKRAGSTLSYVHQDHLTGTSVVSDTNGASAGRIKYYPFGSTRSSTGTLPDQKFTGQRLDGTGLYYYNARYYDAEIGRFISPDSTGQQLLNPQTLNLYSYVNNNPLTYNDPTGHWPNWGNVLRSVAKGIVQGAVAVTGVAVKIAQVTGEGPVNRLADAASGVVLNHTVVPALNLAGAGIEKLSVNSGFGYVEVDVKTGGWLAGGLDKVEPTLGGHAIGITLPTPLGSVAVINQDEAKKQTIGMAGIQAHEETHVIQQDALGPAFVPLYYLGEWAYGSYDNNPFEQQAKQNSNPSLWNP